MEGFENRVNTELINQKVSQIQSALGEIIVGQNKMIEQLIIALFSNGHVLLEGVPGIAKTLSSKLLAQTVNSEFSRIQFTPDLMPSDILGTNIFNVKTNEFEFKKGPIFSNIILIDEINRAPAKTQAALFEVMEERQITMDGTRYDLKFPFIVLATQNPIEQEGTYRLPEAQLDRFIFKIVVDYPDAEEELEILNRQNKGLLDISNKKIEPIITADELRNIQAIVKSIIIQDSLVKYISDLVLQTRSFPGIYLGASPRASIAILNASKAMAAIRGRDFVTPEDIQQVCYPVLRHRIILSPEKEMEGLGSNDLIRLILEKVEVPR